jgi:general secretion pathway protein J
MRMISQNRRYARVARRRSGEQGLTLIELLLSLAILAVLTGFLAGGLSMARRAFDADRANRIATGSNAAIQTISNLIGSALPIPASPGDQVASVMFDGRQEAMVFVGLSEGRSLRGGPHKISLRRNGSDLVVDVIASPAGANKDAPEPPSTMVVVLSGVSEIHFEYFGKIDPAALPGWRTDWSRAQHLPDLVSLRVDFEDARRNEPAFIVALRQG